MPGLREKQKAERDKRILQAAVEKFRAAAYTDVRIEDLADHAGVSVGTVYNYYRNKGDILIAIVAMEVEEVLEAGAALVANPPRGTKDALLALIFLYYDHSLHYLTKEMWRRAMALSIAAPDTPNGARYAELDARLATQVTDLIGALQCRGEVGQDWDAGIIGQVIFNTLNQTFIEFVKDDAMTLETLRGLAAAQIRPLAKMLIREAGA